MINCLRIRDNPAHLANLVVEVASHHRAMLSLLHQWPWSQASPSLLPLELVRTECNSGPDVLGPSWIQDAFSCVLTADFCKLVPAFPRSIYGQMAQDRSNRKCRLDVAASEKLLEYSPPIPVREPSVGTLLPNVALPCQMQRRREQACRPLHSTALSLARATIEA